MPDSETPQPDPEPGNGASDPSAAPSTGSGSPQQPVQSTAPPAGESQGAGGGAPPHPTTTSTLPAASGDAVTSGSTAPSGGTTASGDTTVSEDTPGRVMRAVRSRRGVWAAVAVLCVLAGIAGSTLGARAVARNDAASGRRAFQQTSTSIASTLRIAIRHQEQLVVSASTFFASHPKATHAEFATWVKWARTQRRYPELDALGLLTPAHASPALLLSRDTGLSVYTPVPSASGTALAIETPVYRGYVTPRSVFGRTAASVGWLREVLMPAVVLHEALAGQPGYALRLRYRAGSANVMFAAGAAPVGAQSTATSLHDGWTVKTFAPAAGTGVFADGHALAVLIGGVLLSLLLGLLVFVLSADRSRTRAPQPGATPREDLYDALTGLPNRTLMLDRAERILARAGRHSEVIAGALSIEIDWVKDVNDRLGRAAGDQLLKIVAQRLERVIRTGDTVGRLGGDEFVVLVESAARGVRLDSLARRVIEALHEPVELDGFGPSFVLTASIGVAFGRYTIAEDLLRDAHLAAKAAGKDRYTLFNANMRSVIEGRGVLEVELNTALQEGQFFLLYQPICDLNPRRVVGLEALIRWQHPEQGVLAPADFIPLAEETGLIVPIGRWVLEEACSRAAAWNLARGAAAGGGARVGISVKVSAVQLNRDGFITDVRRALQQSGIEPSLLTLEIAETTVMRGIETAAERLREVKQLGVRIALEDFGSAYASHSDLQRLPLDCLKVDRSSLAASDTEDYRSWLLETILLAGRELSLTVIAKGIETGEQLEALQAKGCTMAQGLLMGAPTSVDAVESLLDADLPTTAVPTTAVPTTSLTR
jgi:diguanylate cyclase (GGDEF)-like protein